MVYYIFEILRISLHSVMTVIEEKSFDIRI